MKRKSIQGMLGSFLFTVLLSSCLMTELPVESLKAGNAPFTEQLLQSETPTSQRYISSFPSFKEVQVTVKTNKYIRRNRLKQGIFNNSTTSLNETISKVSRTHIIHQGGTKRV